MTKLKKLIYSGVGIVLVAGMVGCGGPSDEELALLDTLRSEVKALEQELNSLKSDKTKLEREIAEQKSKIQDCEKQKAAAKANLKKVKIKN